MNFTGEQFVPGIQKTRLVEEHQTRYAFAVPFAKDADVLDIACGTGYGTAELAKISKNAIGVDLSPESIEYARSHFTLPNLKFLQASATDDLFPPDSFDLICSFETIEHLTAEQRKEYLSNLRTWLRPNGVLLLSTPNHKITSPFTAKPLNPYHMHEFTLEGLIDEVTPFFDVRKALGQRLIKKIMVGYFVRKSIHAMQRILGRSFHIYDLANGPAILPFDPAKTEPRIFVLVCGPKDKPYVRF